MSARTPHVVVDCDPGIDDALALAALVHHHAAGRLLLDLVVAVSGNIPLGRAAANARFTLDANGARDVPVLAGAAEPLDGPRDGADHVGVHGDDGLGGWYPSGRVVPSPAVGGVEALVGHVRTLHRWRQRTWVLATGPLTDVALALDLEPELPTMVERLVVMGGALGDPPGTVAPGAEFNFWSDPRAADRVLRAGFPATLVPLDATVRVLMGPDDADALDERSDGPTLATRLLRASIERNRERKELVGAPMHDPLAVAVLLAPSLVRTEPRRLAVVTDGPGAGRVVPSTDAQPVEVVVDVDACRAKRLLLAVLGGNE